MLTTLLPPRRLRYSNRNVKCTTSRYHARDDGRPALSTTIVAINIAVHTPPLHPAATASTEIRHPFRHRPPAPNKPSTPPVPTRRQLVTTILLSEPRRDWHGYELANKLHIKQHNMLTQLSEWARLGFIRRTGTGTYALDSPPPPNWPSHHLTEQLTPSSSDAITTPDGDEKPSKAQRPQHSQDEQPCAATTTVHNGSAPGTDTPTACWT